MDWDLTTQKGMAKLIVIATSLSFEICTFYSLSWTNCMLTEKLMVSTTWRMDVKQGIKNHPSFLL